MIRLVVSAMLLCQAYSYAQIGTAAPCGMDPVPDYPVLGSTPHREVSGASLSSDATGNHPRAPVGPSWAFPR